MDDRGDELVSDSGTVYDTLLTIAVTFTVDETIEDLQIESVTARPRSDGYDDDVEALDELVGITAEVPGLGALVGDDGLPALSTDRRWEAEVNGKYVTVTLQSPFHKDRDYLWSAEIDVSGQKSAVCCFTRDTWAGRGDGFHYGRPVGLVSDDEPAEFSLARFALGAIYGLRDDTPDDRPSPHA